MSHYRAGRAVNYPVARTRRPSAPPCSEDTTGERIAIDAGAIPDLIADVLDQRDVASGERRKDAIRRIAQIGVLVGALAGGVTYGVSTSPHAEPLSVEDQVRENTDDIRHIAGSLVDLQDAQLESVQFFSDKLDAMSETAAAIKPEDYSVLRGLGEARDERERERRAAEFTTD